MGKLFGTDGARGVAITELTCEMAMNIGRAAATVFGANSKKPNILIGKDTRISSASLEAALIAGITSVGADALLLGVVPTPAVAYLVREYGADAGIMISASHNPVEDNGIKLIGNDGYKLPDETEEEIEDIIYNRREKMICKNGTDVGRVRLLQVGISRYINHIIDIADCCFDGLKILVDCANGSASGIAETIFIALGAKCDFLASEPDGCNINKDCGSTHMELLREKTRNGYDLGIAFDGDADRCLAVDEQGNIIDGDKQIAILSKQMKADGKLKNDTAVVTVMSNLGFHEYMNKNGIKTISAPVGDRYVLEEMRDGDYSVGGEQSGHIIFRDYATTGDGLLTAVQLIKLVKNSGKKLSELVCEIKDFPQELIGVRVTNEFKNNWQNDELIALIKEAETEFGTKGRVLVRASGTEPLIRVMVEGEQADRVKAWAEKIADKIKEISG